MFSHNLLRSPQFLLILLVLGLSSAACGLPMEGGKPSPTIEPSVVLPTFASPSETFTAVAPSQTSVPAPTATPEKSAPSQTPPVLAAPTSTRTPLQLSEVTIYFVAVGDNGLSGPKIGCDDSLVAVKQPIEPTSGVIRAALNKLFGYKQQDIGQSGLYNALWQSDLAIESARVDDGVATVYLVGSVMMGGECDIPRFKGQIEQTILAQAGVKEAVVYLNGKRIDEALSLK